MELTNQDGYLTDELRDELQQHFGDGEIFELGMTAGILCGMAKFIFCFDLVTRELTCPMRKGPAA
ncbi:MAG: hypothetical protein R3C15_09405 [Thermoleophilia bacterium]